MIQDFKFFRPNRTELEHFKTISITEFYSKSPSSAKYFSDTCDLYFVLNKLFIATLKQAGDLVVSCFILIKDVKILNSHYKAAMISLVIVQPEYRGRKLLYNFFYELSHYLDELMAPIQFVVARKKVDHMYNKFGFVGFSNFSFMVPSVDIINANPKKSFDKFVASRNTLICELTKSHYINMLFEPLFFFRSKKHWENIVNNMNNFNLDAFLDCNQKKFYLFYQNDSLLELVSNYQIDPESLNDCLRSLNLTKLKMSLHSPYINSLYNYGWNVHVTPTHHGGHLIKVSSNILKNIFIEDSTLKSLHEWYLSSLRSIVEKHPNQNNLIFPLPDKSFSLSYFDEF